MKLYELLAEEDDDLIMALSLVENPAIMASWVYFSADGKKEEIKFATIDEDKKIIVAPVLIPDLKILRIDENTGETYNVFLSKETIEKLAQNYLINGFQKKATLEHDANIDGEVSVVESWVSKSQTKDKSALYFNRTFPTGTWFVTFKVLSDKLWNDYIKTGKVKAVSIEGLLSHKLVKASSHIDLSKEITELSDVEADIVLSQISALFESYTDYGEDIRSNAKRGIELNEKNGNKCATQVGKVRAQAIAKGDPLSVDVIKRMYSYLSRAETYYDETDTTACGTISYLLWGGKSALSWSRNKLSELGLLEEAEANPSIPNSSYPGQSADSGSGYIAPALFAECFPATQDVELNLKNRQNAIDKAMYGPLDIKNPGDYWDKIAERWKVDVETAKGEICGNCAFFDVKQQTLDCIAEGIGDSEAENILELGSLGYCHAFSFKCNSNRSCLAHVDGGPIKD
jgi:hypothetical protein